MKKLLSTVLSLCMLLSIIPVATTSSSAKSIEVVESELLSGDYEYAIFDDGTAVITDYYGSDTNIIVPSEIDGYTVTYIGDHAFTYYSKEITSITIPDSVNYIGYEALGYVYEDE